MKVNLGPRSYEIHFGHNILSKLGQAMSGFGFSSSAGLISNPTVYDLYGSVVERSLSESSLDVTKVLMEDGEEYKNLDTASMLWNRLLEKRLDRSSPIVALGGGVVGDMAGFVAATYMRGIPFVQVPTTLLAQVDSSVGGKVGIDHAQGKNLIGCFYQPRLVWIDLDTLSTLPERELRCGLSEVVKYGAIYDADLFSFLEKQAEALLKLEPGPIEKAVRRCCEIKAEIVAQDEQESGLRAILNFGHTIGHALETLGGYQDLKHGEAVSIGMIAESWIAVSRGLATKEVPQRLEELLQRIGLPVRSRKVDTEETLRVMTVDKKARGGKVRVVLPTQLGHVTFPQAVSAGELKTALDRVVPC